jgi:hypothetical protein
MKPALVASFCGGSQGARGACRMARQPAACGTTLRYSAPMRNIGRAPVQITALPSARGLHEAALQQQIGKAMAAVSSTGIVKGVYRFHTHQEADAQRIAALVRVIAANAARQRRAP